MELETNVQLIATTQSVALRLKTALSPGLEFTGFLKEKLALQKISHGILWPIIEEIGLGKRTGLEHIIAKAIPPSSGVDAHIEEKVDILRALKPKVREDGSTDYKNLDTICQVTQGQLLAVKIPALPGAPGVDVYGNPIPSVLGKDIPLRGGNNTTLSPDGIRLTATTSGNLIRQQGLMAVEEELVHPGDVDFSSGNISFVGKVTIQGSVRDGFRVESDGDIRIEGIVEGAEIISKSGNIYTKTIAGKNKAKVVAGMGVVVEIAQGVELQCKGYLEVGKSLINCNITAKGIKANLSHCKIAGGNFHVRERVDVAILGADAAKTEIIFEDDNIKMFQQGLAELQKKRDVIQLVLDPLDKKLRGIKAMAQKAGATLTPKLVEEIKTMVQQHGAKQKELNHVDIELRMVSDELKALKNLPGRLCVKEKVEGNVKLMMYDQGRNLTQGDVGKLFSWNTGAIVEESSN